MKLRHRRSHILLETLESRQLLSAASFGDALRHESGSNDYVAAVHATLTPSAALVSGAARTAPVVGSLNTTVTGLVAQYFLGDNFQTAVLAQNVSTIAVKWGKGAPDASLIGHTYTARYEGQVTPAVSGAYTFFLKATGGMRLYVNNQLVINGWATKGSKELKGIVTLTAGQAVNVRVEYRCLNGVNGAVQLSWQQGKTKKVVMPASAFTSPIASVATNAGLAGQYFLGENFEMPVITRTDSIINNLWGSGTPGGQIAAGAAFSARWTGQIQSRYSENYTFSTESDDGVRVWVNGQLLIDNWTVHAGTENQGTIALTAGTLYDVKVEYFQNNIAPATMQLFWQSTSQAMQIVPASAFTLTPVPVTYAAGVLSGNPISANEVDLAWTGASSAVGTILSRSGDNGATWTTLGTTAAGVSTFADTTVSGGTNYLYRIVPNVTTTSTFSNTLAALTVPADPQNVTTTSTSATAVLVNWSAVTGAVHYIVERSTDGVNFAALATVDSTVQSYSDNTLPTDTQRWYRIRATDSSGDSGPSGIATLTMSTPTVTGAPTGVLALPVSSSRIDVSWTPVSGATGYVIQRSTDGATFVDLTTAGANATWVSDTSGLAGTEYFYRIFATNTAGRSPASLPAFATTLPNGALGLSAQALSSGAITLAWNSASGATNYTVQLSTDGVHFSDLGTVGGNTLTYTATGLAASTLYTFRIVSINTSGNVIGTPASATTIAGAPTNLTATVSSNGIALNWNVTVGATGYIVERSADGITAWSTIVTTANTNTLDAGLAPGTTFYYRVKAQNSGGISVAGNIASGLTLPAAPTGLLATSLSATQINLLWTPIAGATSAIVQRSTDGVNFTTLTTVNAGNLAYSDNSVSASTTYTYRIIGTNATGSGGVSNLASATAAPLSIFALPSAIYGVTADGNVFAVNTLNATSTHIGVLAFGTAAAGRDPVTGNLYIIEQGTATPRLAFWNPTTGSNTIVSTLNLTGTVTRATFRADGTLFLTAGNGDLYTVNTSTGVATRLGTITTGGVPLPDNSGDLAFSSAGTLYLSANTLMYTINTTTLTATPFGSMGLGAMQITYGNGGGMTATNGSGNLYSLNLVTLLPTLLGIDNNSTSFTDLASMPVFADLGVSQVGSLIHLGGTATYTISAANVGPNATTGPIVITDTLPSGLAYTSATGTGWTFSASGSTITMTYTGSVAVNASLPTITMVTAVSASALTSLTNNLTISSTMFDPNLLNNSSALLSIAI